MMQATVVAAKGIRVAAPHESTQSRLRERIRLQCNIGTMKPECEAPEFQGSRIKARAAWVAYGAYWVLAASPPLLAKRGRIDIDKNVVS